jgi:hypothetical protein
MTQLGLQTASLGAVRKVPRIKTMGVPNPFKIDGRSSPAEGEPASDPYHTVVKQPRSRCGIPHLLGVG